MYHMWIRKLLFIALLLFATDSYAEKLVIFGDEAYAPLIYQAQRKPQLTSFPASLRLFPKILAINMNWSCCLGSAPCMKPWPDMAA